MQSIITRLSVAAAALALAFSSSNLRETPEILASQAGSGLWPAVTLK